MSLLQLLLALFYPERCVFCRERNLEGNALPGVCGTCFAGLPMPETCCEWCGHPRAEPDAANCPACRECRYSFRRTCAVSHYRGDVKKAIHRFKYGGRQELAGPLGKLMALRVSQRNWLPFDAVVPVPLHPERLLSRGYDQALLLAQVVGSELNLPVMRLLVRARDTTSQTRLNAAERWENVNGVFQIAENTAIPPRILLVDDLLTTGATAHYASQALLAAGAGEVCLAVIGR